jgi:hypothetical protein
MLHPLFLRGGATMPIVSRFLVRASHGGGPAFDLAASNELGASLFALCFISFICHDLIERRPLS